MKYLVLSDIHASLYALQAVLADAKDYEQIIFLGDLANFGPHPSECVDLLREYSPVCIMGNHDRKIAYRDEKRNSWDEWSRTKLSDVQLNWIANFDEKRVLNDNILLIHGTYYVEYDILPNTPDDEIRNAFRNHIVSETREIWFGHYHYEVEKSIDGVIYRCVRPVGHHRDHDVRASYSIYENGVFTNYRIPYDIEKTVFDIDNIDCLDEKTNKMWKDLLRNAFHDEFLKKDIIQMKINDEKR